MNKPLPYCLIKPQISDDLLRYCVEYQMNYFHIVTDQNLYPILGNRVEKALLEHGFDVKTTILDGNPVIPNEQSIMRILTRIDEQPRIMVAVGSGTITDMVRFVSSRTKCDFISLPTAPSMDGYASTGSALTLEGMKHTIICKAPIAIFADIEVLKNAPQAMIASGFGDVLGKYTSLADWALGHLLWDDVYSSEIAVRTRKNIETCVQLIPKYHEDSDATIHALIEALIDVGICMLLVGNSRPASGSEHHCSHFWELKHLREGLPDVSHGMKVGFAETLITQKYEQLRKIRSEDVQKLLALAKRPRLEQEIHKIQTIYGSIADSIIQAQEKFIYMSEESHAELSIKIIEKWEEIQAIAKIVPPPTHIQKLLAQAGIPTNHTDLHISSQEVDEALKYSHYLRPNFTILKLFTLFGLQ